MRDQDQIVELLFKFGGIPPEVTNLFILPHLDLLPCGCTYQNKDRVCPKFKIKKGQPHTCIRCKKQTVFKNSHYCIFCKCNVMDSYCLSTGETFMGCSAPCIGYLKYCQNHKYKNRHKEKGLWNRLDRCCSEDICSPLECMGIAKEYKFKNIEYNLNDNSQIIQDYTDVLRELKLKQM